MQKVAQHMLQQRQAIMMGKATWKIKVLKSFKWDFTQFRISRTSEKPKGRLAQ